MSATRRHLSEVESQVRPEVTPRQTDAAKRRGSASSDRRVPYYPAMRPIDRVDMAAIDAVQESDPRQAESDQYISDRRMQPQSGQNVNKERRTALQPRLDFAAIAPDAAKAMWELEKYVRKCSLERPLLELVKFRASQINGCAYCIDMHTKDARAGGETEQRLYALTAWREAPFFTDRERAALAWTEAVTKISKTHVPDEVYELASQHFSEKELADLTVAIVAINGWNRLAISFRKVPGAYQAATH